MGDSVIIIEIVVFLVVGVGIGIVIGTLIGRNKRQELQTSNEVLRTQLEGEKQRAETEVANSQRRIKESHDEWEAHARSMREEADKRHKEAFDSQEGRFKETLAKVTAQMKLATEEMLKQRQKEFAESSNAGLGQIVTPLKETIEEMKKAMQDSTRLQTRISGEMKTNIENMMRQSESAKRSTDELTRAFKHESEVQGIWGETVLDKLLTSQGLTQGIHYDIQPVIRDASGNTIKTEKGSSMRPDVILHLDGKREVVIDSKVSLTAYIDYVNAKSEEERSAKLKEHVNSLNKHVDELSKKDYSSYIQPPKVKMDYVIMFVPHTAALWTALNTQPNLWRKAMEKNVYIADEQTLYAALRIIQLTWTQITQAQNHEKVFNLANEMMDRVGQFMKRYDDLGKALDKARETYEDGKKKLQPDGQSILQTCGKLKKLGAKPSSKNPLPQLEDIDDVPAIEDNPTGNE